MRKHIFVIIVALGIAGIFNVGQTHAQVQSIRVDVPFAFTANNKTLPAGTYTLNPQSNGRAVWRIQSSDPEPGSAFLIAMSVSGNLPSEIIKVTFRRYGDQHFLVGFNTPSYQVDLPKSRSEKYFVRTGNALSEYEVVTIQTKQILTGGNDEK